MGSGDEKYAKKFHWRQLFRKVVMVLFGLVFLGGMMWGSIKHFFD